MNTTDLLVLGLLVLVANLTLSALFVPPKARPSATEPLLRLWKLLALAFAQITAWAVVLDQGGASDSLADAFLRAAGCFALVSGVQGAPVFAAPWNQFAGLIALNGLLFIPVTLLPALFPAAAPDAAPSAAESSQRDDKALEASPPAATAGPSSLAQPPARNVSSEPLPTASAPQAQAVASSAPQSSSGATAAPASAAVTAASSPLVADAGKRPFPPPQAPAAPAPPSLAPPVDAEAEYAALMRPPGPTPPPIRFGNRP